MLSEPSNYSMELRNTFNARKSYYKSKETETDETNKPSLLLCPLGCRSDDSTTPVLVYANPESFEHMELNAKYWRTLCQIIDKNQEKMNN